MPLWLIVTNGVWLAVAAYTDLTRQRVYRWWSLGALVLGLVTALTSPDRTLHLILGLIFLALSSYWWVRAERQGRVFGGGDVWMLTYLGFVWGPELAIVLLVGGAIILIHTPHRQLREQPCVPLAGYLALAAVVVLIPMTVINSPNHLADGWQQPLEPTSPASVSLTPVPMQTPPTAIRQECADQAAWAVGWVGLAEAGTRQQRAAGAAQQLRDLAVRCPQATLFQAWAAALDRFAGGDTAALAAIQQYSAENRQTGDGSLPSTP